MTLWGTYNKQFCTDALLPTEKGYQPIDRKQILMDDLHTMHEGDREVCQTRLTKINWYPLPYARGPGFTPTFTDPRAGWHYALPSGFFHHSHKDKNKYFSYLRTTAPTSHIAADVGEYVLMPQQHGGVDLRLAPPARLVAGEKYLHRHAVRVPRAAPHLAVATLRGTDCVNNRKITLLAIMDSFDYQVTFKLCIYLFRLCTYSNVCVKLFVWVIILHFCIDHYSFFYKFRYFMVCHKCHSSMTTNIIRYCCVLCVNKDLERLSVT